MHSSQTISSRFYNTFPISDALRILDEILSMNCMLNGNIKVKWAVLPSISNVEVISDDAKQEVRLYHFGIESPLESI